MALREDWKRDIITNPHNIGTQFSLAYNSTITQGKTMENPTPTKQFVTKNVPGFEDGHPVYLNEFEAGRPGLYPEFRFNAERVTETGIKVKVTIPCTPENVEAHVRVKAVKPPKVEKA